MTSGNNKHKSNARSAAALARSTAEEIEEDVAHLGRETRAALQEAASNIRGDVQDAATRIKRSAGAKADQMRASVGDVRQAARDRFEGLEEGIAARIREKPLAALGLAALAGLFVGAFWIRRR